MVEYVATELDKFVSSFVTSLRNNDIFQCSKVIVGFNIDILDCSTYFPSLPVLPGSKSSKLSVCVVLVRPSIIRKRDRTTFH